MGLTPADRRWGSGPAPLVLLHGFTGTGAAFDALAPLLGGQVTALCPDLPGHGASPPAGAPAGGWSAAVAAVAEACARASSGPVHLAGYSLGARLALAVALERPALVRTLVLESGTAGLATEDERAARRAADEALARSIERQGVAAFVARWEANEVLAGLRSLPAEAARALEARRLAQSPAGLAWALRALGQGAQPALWEQLSGLRAPALLVHGALDAKYAALAARLAAGLPRAALVSIEGAGHAPHLEQPARFAAALRAHLARAADAPATHPSAIGSTP